MDSELSWIDAPLYWGAPIGKGSHGPQPLEMLVYWPGRYLQVHPERQLFAEDSTLDSCSGVTDQSCAGYQQTLRNTAFEDSKKYQAGCTSFCG